MNGSILLRPLDVSDAAAMSDVLADPSLYEFTGGQAPSAAELEHQYQIQTRGCSPDGTEKWVNLIVELEPGGHPIGYVQATVIASTSTAEIS